MSASRTLLAAAALLGLVGTAQARDLVVNDNGENFSVSYAADYIGNVVGGGAVRTQGNGNTLAIIYEDERFTQAAEGTPVDRGGSNGEVAYLASTSVASR